MDSMSVTMETATHLGIGIPVLPDRIWVFLLRNELFRRDGKGDRLVRLRCNLTSITYIIIRSVPSLSKARNGL